MPSANPAFTRNPVFNGKGVRDAAPTLSSTQLQDMYERPSAVPTDTSRMTYDDTIVKTALLFAVLLAGAVVGWIVPGLYIVGALAGLVLGLVNSFKREPSPALIIAYAAAEGLFVGGISHVFEGLYDGIVIQAVLATLAVFGTTLALFANGKIRASKRATKIFLIAMVGYAVFSLLNFVLMIAGVFPADNMFGARSGIVGIIIGVLAILMAAYSLVLDFDFVQRGVKTGAPRKYGWSAAFGLTVTLVWLYVELLRLIAIFRN
ncbi:Bax inhibitor-1/YccA family protein [Agreia sp. COWG]|uniref:Bax inhibitor-1/YccA family protein n=1 Tax=Agreia sp. COWG TaxID=2773266 RepID=UPI00192562CE|nr:Bax inhibitor-1/YccA family protein [Agreia sp. COWG]CAD6004119.1 conserved membrane protein of unknown function [Agreia sp. COWG]